MSIDIKPGKFVYYGGHGLSVVIGRKNIPLGGDVWELRKLQDIHSPLMIPAARINPIHVREMMTKEDFTECLAAFCFKTTEENYSKLEKEKEAQRLVSSTNPLEIINVVHSLIGSKYSTKKELETMPARLRAIIDKGIGFLADDLVMASGLSFKAARAHIIALALGRDHLALWPADAPGPKPAAMESSAFQAAFGIDFHQAMNINTNPPRLASKNLVGGDGRRKDETLKIVLAALREQAIDEPETISEPELAEERPDTPAMTEIETHAPVETSASAQTPPEPEKAAPVHDRSDVYKTLTSIVASKGAMRGAFDLAFKILELQDFELVTKLFFVQPDMRMDIESLSRGLNMPVEKLRERLKDALLEYGNAARAENKRAFVLRSMFELCPDISDFGVKRGKILEGTASIKPEFTAATADENVASQPDESLQRSEDDVYEDISRNGWSAATLDELGAIHESEGDMEGALFFYGASSDLENKPSPGLRRIETILGYCYDSAIHFETLDHYIQAKLNGKDAPDLKIDLYTPYEEAFQEPPHSPEIQTEIAPVDTFHPRVTYALPAEIFIPGQSLKMSFRKSADGGLDVTLEVQKTAQTETGHADDIAIEITRASDRQDHASSQDGVSLAP